MGGVFIGWVCLIMYLVQYTVEGDSKRFCEEEFPCLLLRVNILYFFSFRLYFFAFFSRFYVFVFFNTKLV